VRDLIKGISTYNGNVLLAAVISLLVVIIFVLLLHIYARWFIARAQRRRHASTISRTPRFHNLDSSTLETSLATKGCGGLEPSEISSIPLFVYKAEEVKQRLECVICLSSFEENEIGRKLEKCEHSFHVGCIDMWLHSHSNCPLCRAPPMLNNTFDGVNANWKS
jgi:hypothetical protein